MGGMGMVPAFLDSHTYPFVSSRLVWEEERRAEGREERKVKEREGGTRDTHFTFCSLPHLHSQRALGSL